MTSPNLARRLAEVAHDVECVLGEHDYPPCKLRIESTAQALADEMPGWQDISSAPRDGTMFLAVNMRGGSPGMNRYELCFSAKCDEGEHWAADAGWRNPGRDWPAYPTHWQPLPPPPRSGEEGKGT